MIAKLMLKNISCRRGKRVLFKPVSCCVNAGELFQIQGPNGCGKSTLLSTIVGFLSPASGHVVLCDSAKERSLMKEDVVYCGHLYGIHPNMTVSEQIEFHRVLNESEKEQNILELLDTWRLSGYRQSLVKSLSAGQKQRLSLMRLHFSDAKIWVLDEPYVNLDKAGRKTLDAYIEQHLGAGGMVLITNHQATVSAQTLILAE